MKGVSKVFNAITIIFGVLLIFWLFQLNYQDLSFKENRNVYFGISSIVLMMVAIQMVKRSIHRKNEK